MDGKISFWMFSRISTAVIPLSGWPGSIFSSTPSKPLPQDLGGGLGLLCLNLLKDPKIMPADTTLRHHLITLVTMSGYLLSIVCREFCALSYCHERKDCQKKTLSECRASEKVWVLQLTHDFFGPCPVGNFMQSTSYWKMSLFCKRQTKYSIDQYCPTSRSRSTGRSRTDPKSTVGKK